MKRLLSFTLVTLLSLSVMCSTVFAATPQITAKNLDIHKSEEIIVSFNITPKSGLSAAGFSLTYDHDKFTYVDYGYGEAFDEKGVLATGYDNGDVKDDGVGLFKYGYVNTEGAKNGGEMFFVIFKTSDTVKVGEKYEFKLTCTEAVDKDHNNIEINKEVILTATVLEGVAPSKAETSRVVGDTSATIEAETVLNSEDSAQDNQTKTDAEGKGSNTVLLIIIAVLAVIIVAAVVVIILVLIKKKQNAPEEDVMTKILADDAETDFLDEDALADETSSDIDEYEEIDEVDE